MAEIINLRREKKRRQRREDAATAASNRGKYGRSKAERQHDDRARSRHDAELDGKLLPDGDEPPIHE